MFNIHDTICATATAQGIGALGIIRISGNDAISIANKVFKGKNLLTVDSHTVHYGYIINPTNQEVIDEVMVSVFKAPKTFTAEDLVEISCHGSPYIQDQIIQILLQNGARLAEAGEFTQRAFLNCRIDLTQAEAVADLIAAESKASHDLALNQMRGGFSSDLKQMREELINFVSLIELELDFSEEDVEFANREHLNGLIDQLLDKIHSLIDSFQYGNAIKSGIPVAIVGKPNAGKSTLLNALLNEERAIVSSIAGTTRDTIEEKMVIDGIEFRFIDTAGIRETDDEIESLGIQKTFEKAQQSQVILYLFDKENTSPDEVVKDYKTLETDVNDIIIIPTKLDLYADYDWTTYFDKFNEEIGATTIVGISAYTKSNLNLLKEVLSDYVKSLKGNYGNNVVVNQRHWQELKQTEEALALGKEALKTGVSSDWVAMHLRTALKHLGNITGQIDIDQDILGTIFGKFCVGK